LGIMQMNLCGQPVEMLQPPHKRGLYSAERAAYFAYPDSRMVGADRELYGFRKDGTEFPVEVSLSPIETDDGRFSVSAIRDITERKRIKEIQTQLRRDLTEREIAEKALFEEKELLRFTLSCIGDAVITTDTEGRITYLNPIAEAVSLQMLVDAITGIINMPTTCLIKRDGGATSTFLFLVLPFLASFLALK